MSDLDVPFRTRPFRDPSAAPGSLPADAAAALLLAAGDVALVMDRDGLILDIAISDAALDADGAAGWPGRTLADLVTIESKPKIRELLAEAAAGRPPRWRQVNHPVSAAAPPGASPPDAVVPVRYACVAAGERLIAIGRDLRGIAATQQRLLQTQQSLERDYLRLRQAESRYRLLFDLSDEPVLIVDLATRRIVEANPAAHRAAGMAPGALVRQPASLLAAAESREALIAQLGAAGGGAPLAATAVVLAGGTTAQLTATPFRQDRATFLLVRLGVTADACAPSDEAAGDARLAKVIEQMPDAFVLTTRRLEIVAANAAFVELAQGISAAALEGEPLGGWLGRPGIDLELIAGQLREHGVARNIATILRGGSGAQEEVEVSGVAVETAEGPHYGFTIRGVARRLRDLPPAERDLPRSVEQLTELVGRVSLKEIVRESTDLIERLCIEAALSFTSDNRASAAEVLGLSRQSLYSKLHRHGLGNLADDRE